MWLHWDLQLPQACNSAQLNVVWVSVGILIGQCPECDVGFVLMLNSQCLSASAFKSSLTVKLSFYCLLFIFLRSSRPQLFHSWQKYTYIWTIKFFGPRVKSINSISNRGLSPHDVTHLIYFEVPFWSLESTIMAEATLIFLFEPEVMMLGQKVECERMHGYQWPCDAWQTAISYCHSKHPLIMPKFKP